QDSAAKPPRHARPAPPHQRSTNPPTSHSIPPMTASSRKIEVASETAALLEARTAARGLSVADLVPDLAGAEALPAPLADERAAGRGPWAEDVLADDARRLQAFRETGEGFPLAEVAAWMASWGNAEELPPPAPRKL